MIFHHSQLSLEEAVILKQKIKQYQDYDRLDLLIELIFDKKQKNKIKNRKIKKIIIPEKNGSSIPEELKYCTGDSCSVN